MLTSHLFVIDRHEYFPLYPIPPFVSLSLFLCLRLCIRLYDTRTCIKGGGSIRIPASFNGAVGLATTFGRLGFEKRHGSTMIKGGPIAATVDDAAIAYIAMVSLTSPTSHAHVLFDMVCVCVFLSHFIRI